MYAAGGAIVAIDVAAAMGGAGNSSATFTTCAAADDLGGVRESTFNRPGKSMIEGGRRSECLKAGGINFQASGKEYISEVLFDLPFSISISEVWGFNFNRNDVQRFCVATGGKTAFFFNLSPVSSDLPDAQYSSVCFVVDTKQLSSCRKQLI